MGVRQYLLRPAPVVAHAQQIGHFDLGANGETGEVDDNVVALRRRPAHPGGQGNGVHHQVAIVGNELERYRSSCHIGKRQLDEAGHAHVQNSEAIFPRQHLEVGRVREVHERNVAQKPVGIENI